MLVCYADTKSNQGYITEGTDFLCRKYLHGASGVPYWVFKTCSWGLFNEYWSSFWCGGVWYRPCNWSLDKAGSSQGVGSESTTFWSPSWASVSRGSVLPVWSLHCSVLASESQFMEIKFCEMIAFSNVDEVLGRRGGKKAGENWVFIPQCVINIPRGIQVAIAHLKFGLTSVLL